MKQIAGSWPMTREGREAARMEAVEFHTRVGVAKGLHYAQSMRCRDGDHHRWWQGEYVGCRNDGSNCLCICHDPAK